MDSVCCLCLGYRSEKASSFSSVFTKDCLILIILCTSHLPLASSCMTDLPLLWPFFLCVLQADLPIYMGMFGVGNWSWPEKKKNTRGGRLRIFSITGVFMGGWIPVFIYRLICLILRLMLKELILAFHFSFGFITRSPVTSVTSCLPISKLVWWSLFSFIPRCLLFFVSSSYTLEPCRRLCFLSGKIPWSTVLEDLLYPSSTDMQSCRVFW